MSVSVTVTDDATGATLTGTLADGDETDFPVGGFLVTVRAEGGWA